MSVVSIPSLDLFTPALSYHTTAQTFLSDQGVEILTRAKALSAELHTSSPQFAAEFDKTIQALAQRFTDEAKLSGDAVTNLNSHFTFLATAEAKLSGTTPATLPALTLPNTSTWLQIHNTPVDSCFDELDSQLYQFKQDLDAFEPRVKDFEHLVWVAVNQPDQLKNLVQVPAAGWEPDWLKTGIQDVVNVGTDAATAALRPAIDFIQAHQTDIFSMIDNMRQGFESIFLPRTDPHVLQAHIDYLSALKTAYDTNIRTPFDTSTRPIATQYQPPVGQNSYQLAWAAIPDQQLYTSNALGNIIGQLQQLQGFNQLIALDLLIIVGLVVGFLVLIVASAAIVTLIGTLPGMFADGFTVAGTTVVVAGTQASFGTVLAGLFGAVFGGLTLWDLAIVPIGLAIVDLGWLLNQPGTKQWEQDLINSITGPWATSQGDIAVKDAKDAALQWARDHGINVNKPLSDADRKRVCDWMTSAMSTLSGLINKWQRVKNPDQSLIDELEQQLEQLNLHLLNLKKQKDVLKAIRDWLQQLKNGFKTQQKDFDCRQNRSQGNN